MSGIITSFFIEPVVRQARRFSGLPQPSNNSPVCTNTHDLDNSPGNSASIFDAASNNADGSQRARASSMYQHKHVQSHANASAGCSRSPHNSSSSPVTAFDVNSASHKPQSSACTKSSIGSPAAVSDRRSSLSLGQALFDRFAPLVSSTRPSPPSSARQANRVPIETESHADGFSLSGTQNDDTESKTCSSATHNTPDVVGESHAATPRDFVSMNRLNDHGLRLPGSNHDPRDAVDEDMPRRIHQHTVLSRSEARRRREAAIQTSEALSSVMKDKGAAMSIEDEVEIRRRIQEIWKQPISTEEKSRAMHLVLNEKYLASIEEKQQDRITDVVVSHIRPNSSSSFNSLHSSTISAGDIEVFKRYNVAPEDLIPTLRPVPTEHYECSRPRRSSSNLASLSHTVDTFSDDEDEDEGPDLGCEHYKRNIKIQCFECKTWWNCRYCHDSADTGHKLPRQRTENMLCMLCQTPGPAGQYCTHCGEQAAYYYCDICKLWDDDPIKHIYHCSDCGICRIGMGLGKDFKHCKRCNVCIPITQYDWHKCLERATECDCPICGDYLFTSLSPIVSMPCGHYLHQSCYNEYMQNAYQCPICKKSAKNMASQWRKLEEEIGRQPMPTNLRNISVDVRCNDCAGRSRVPFHWLGNKCELCDSFNTVEIELHRDRNGPGLAPSPPRGNWRNARSIPQTRAPRYFQDDEEQTRNTSANGNEVSESTTTDSLLALPNTAYELLSNQFAAMRRNLSPIRRYLNAVEESPNAATEAEIERMGFWQLGSSPRANSATVLSGNDRDNHNNDEWDDENQEDDDEDEDEDDDEANDNDDDDDDTSSNSSDREFIYDDDESDSSSDSGLDIQLIGHR